MRHYKAFNGYITESAKIFHALHVKAISGDSAIKGYVLPASRDGSLKTEAMHTHIFIGFAHFLQLICIITSAWARDWFQNSDESRKTTYSGTNGSWC